jgi:hypothetical protein
MATVPTLLLGRRRVDRFLAAWFVVMLVVLAMQGALSVEALGTDANLYRFAASSYLAGDDPWNRAGGDWGVFQFAGLPPTILAFVPFAFLPEHIVIALWVALSVAAAIGIVSALRLPLYWLLFPPLVAAVWSGNPHIVVVVLLLGRAAFLAPILKIYGAVPLIGERRWYGGSRPHLGPVEPLVGEPLDTGRCRRDGVGRQDVGQGHSVARLDPPEGVG